LSGLLDFLHLLANPRPRRLISALSLTYVSLDFSYQHLKLFVLLHSNNPPLSGLKLPETYRLTIALSKKNAFFWQKTGICFGSGS